MSLKDDQWNRLMHSIEKEQCAPFIGPEAYAPFIPPSVDRAKKWAEEHNYPLADSNQLAKVAQFLALVNDTDDVLYPKYLLSQELQEVKAPDFALEKHRNTPYAVLADLNLPIYITTNYDNFMEAALKSKGKDPITEFCRWHDDVQDYATNAGIISIFEKEKDYAPSSARPLVYHLHGVLDRPPTMVLTEKDYIDFVISLNKYDDKRSLPSVIRIALATTELLFVGFSLEDIAFRVIFQGVMSVIGDIPRPVGIAVQLPPDFPLDKQAKLETAQKYLNSYTKNLFKVSVYWGNIDKFVAELRQRWDVFRSANA